jgi:hypothetical protein
LGVQDHNSPIHASQILGMTGIHYCTWFLLGVSWNSCLGWPRTTILPISTSQVARIIRVSHFFLMGSQFLISLSSCTYQIVFLL